MSHRPRPALPWELGAIARAAGLNLADNPYTGRTISAGAWARGWRHEDQSIAGEPGYVPAEIVAEEEREACA